MQKIFFGVIGTLKLFYGKLFFFFVVLICINALVKKFYCGSGPDQHVCHSNTNPLTCPKLLSLVINMQSLIRVSVGLNDIHGRILF